MNGFVWLFLKIFVSFQGGKPGGTFDTLYISDIGYGMNGGPISMGRFGLGKYMPPDRSSEILPIEKKEENITANDALAKEASAIQDDDKADNDGPDKSSIIKAMMDQVIRVSSKSAGQTGNGPAVPTGSNMTYIRDAERFTEISAASLPETACSKIAQSIPSMKSPQKSYTAPTVTEVKETPILKSQELDLDWKRKKNVKLIWTNNELWNEIFEKQKNAMPYHKLMTNEKKMITSLK